MTPIRPAGTPSAVPRPIRPLPPRAPRRRLLAAVAATCAVVPVLWTGPADAASERWVPPVQPLEVVRPFAPPLVRWGPGHRGVDLRSSAGATVRAVGAGVVVFAGAVAGRGVVSVQHGTLRTTYEPVDATVAAGQQIAAGAAVGTLSSAVGLGHCPPAACLHLGLRRGEHYLDPMVLFRPVRVRLLPLSGRAAAAARPQERAAHGLA